MSKAVVLSEDGFPKPQWHELYNEQIVVASLLWNTFIQDTAYPWTDALNVWGRTMQCGHASKKLFFLNCCGVFDSNYFQAAHLKITIKVNDVARFSVGLKRLRICRCFTSLEWIMKPFLPFDKVDHEWTPTNSDKRVQYRMNIRLILSLWPPVVRLTEVPRPPPSFELFSIPLLVACYLSN